MLPLDLIIIQASWKIKRKVTVFDNIPGLNCLSSHHIPLVQISVDGVQKADGSSASLDVKFLITVISSYIQSSGLIIFFLIF